MSVSGPPLLAFVTTGEVVITLPFCPRLFHHTLTSAPHDDAAGGGADDLLGRASLPLKVGHLTDRCTLSNGFSYLIQLLLLSRLGTQQTIGSFSGEDR